MFLTKIHHHEPPKTQKTKTSQRRETTMDDDGAGDDPLPPGGGLGVPDLLPPEGDNFPDCLLDDISGQPPQDPVRLNIADRNGAFSLKVFEKATLYRWICTLGTAAQARRFVHPWNHQSVPREKAWDLVVPVPPDVRMRIATERRRRGLTDNVPPIDQGDRDKYKEMERRMASR